MAIELDRFADDGGMDPEVAVRQLPHFVPQPFEDQLGRFADDGGPADAEVAMSRMISHGRSSERERRSIRKSRQPQRPVRRK